MGNCTIKKAAIPDTDNSSGFAVVPKTMFSGGIHCIRFVVVDRRSAPEKEIIFTSKDRYRCELTAFIFSAGMSRKTGSA